MRAPSLFLKRSRGSTIKLHFFSCCIFLSNNFDVSFFVTLTILDLVYTPRKHVVFRYKLRKLSPHPPKYHNIKEVYAFEFTKQVQFCRQNETLPRAKFLSVNQQQKQNQDYYNKKVVKRP